MHIAVCDDNFADRHQMERLLGRESDKEGDSSRMYYVDSYGSPETMLAHPKAYDLFFIDVCRTEGLSSLGIVTSLINKGATAPFVLCISNLNYRKMAFPENTLFLDKPIKVAELRAVIEEAKKLKQQAPDTIELRKITETIYANVSDVIYAYEKDEKTYVILRDGQKLESVGKLWLFKRALEEKHPEFIYANKKTLINCYCVKGLSRLGLAVTDTGKKIFLTRQAKEQMKEFIKL